MTAKKRRKIERDYGGAPPATFWMSRIQQALRDRAKAEQDWDENQRLMQAKTVVQEGFDEHDAVWINHMLVNTRQVVSSLIAGQPRFNAKPDNELAERSAPLATANMDRCARVCDLEDQIDQSAFFGCYCSFAYIKVGWQLEEHEVGHEFGPTGEDVWSYSGQQEPLSAVKPELNTLAFGSGAFSYVVDPFNLLRSPGSTNIDNASWVAERIFLRYEDLQADRTLKNVELVHPNASPRTSDYGSGSRASFAGGRRGDRVTPERVQADPGDSLVEVWEVWDRSFRQKLLITPGVDDPLKEGEWPYRMGRYFPYTELCFQPIGSEPNPMPLASVFKELSLKKNKIESYKYRHVRVSTPRVLFNAQQVDPEDEEQFLDGDPLPFLGVDGDPTTAVHVYGGAQMNTDVQYVDGSLDVAINKVGGFQDYVVGGQAPSQTATMTNSQTAGMNVRLEYLRRRLKRFIKRWAILMDHLHRQFLDQPTQVKIAGEAALHGWTEYSGVDFTGQYDWEVIDESIAPENVLAERQQYTDMINVLAALFDPTQKLNGKEMIRQYLSKWKVPHIDKIIGEDPDIPPADPAVENQLMLEGGNPPVSKQENFAEHLQFHEAAEQELLASPQPDQDAIARVRRHMQATQAVMKQVMLDQLLQAQMDAQLAAAAGGAPGAAIERGPGQGGPAAAGAVRPELHTERNTDAAKITGAAAREQEGPPQ